MVRQQRGATASLRKLILPWMEAKTEEEQESVIKSFPRRRANRRVAVLNWGKDSKTTHPTGMTGATRLQVCCLELLVARFLPIKTCRACMFTETSSKDARHTTSTSLLIHISHAYLACIDWTCSTVSYYSLSALFALTLILNIARVDRIFHQLQNNLNGDRHRKKQGG